MTRVSSVPAIGAQRRRVLQGLITLAAASAAPVSVTRAFAASDASDFLAVSQLLTGRSVMPADFGDALLAAFTKIDADFPAKVARLNAYIKQNQTAAADLQAKLKADTAMADIAAVPASILTGWYLGVAGSGEQAICVAYVDALANQTVADVLRPQSYSYGAYGTWAAKPA